MIAIATEADLIEQWTPGWPVPSYGWQCPNCRGGEQRCLTSSNKIRLLEKANAHLGVCGKEGQ